MINLDKVEKQMSFLEKYELTAAKLVAMAKENM